MRTRNGLSQCTRVLFGISSAPSAFKKIISKITERCSRIKTLLYDIVLAGVGFADHEKNHKMILQNLREWNARANTSKCSFGVDSVDFAPHQISKDWAPPIESNTQRPNKIEPPTNVNECDSFLSNANYNLRFLPHFAEIAKPVPVILRNMQTSIGLMNAKMDLKSCRDK